jgi:hypothetical protein
MEQFKLKIGNFDRKLFLIELIYYNFITNL